MEHRNDILWRTYLVYIFMCVFALAIVYRIVQVQFIEGDMWREKAKQLTTAYVDIEASRGNIFDENGNLLATSLPYYEVGMDVNAPSLSKDTFNKYVTPLSEELAQLFPDKSKKEFKKILRKARETKDRYIVLHRNVSYKDLLKIRKFPMLKKGARGGLAYIQTNKRERPFKILASRTIGYTMNEYKVGIEGAYDSILRGTSGKRLMQKVAADVWRPINDENEVDPKNGSDIYTTIDVNIQDVAENALLKALVKNDASQGCVVLMEVKTGEIRAIANLTRTDSGMYSERLNYAMGYPTEPGSTFKLASLLVALDDEYVDLDDKFYVGNGECMYYDKKVKDSHPPKKTELTVQEIFETSSNVGVTKIITQYYSKNPQKFVDKLLTFNLGKPLGLGIPGEGKPLVKSVRDKHWSGVTLPQMSYGYEVLVTPLQTLTLYNAIANNGRMVKPRFIREIKTNGITVKKFTPEIIDEQIVKASTVRKARTMMEGVVERGTGKGLNITAFKVAGKTGTAQMAVNGTYGTEGNHIYQSSFVGYFPAENPLYTCIIIISSPSKGVYYGGLVSGPVFKEIAEKVYSGSLDFQQEINDGKQFLTKAPEIIKGKKQDLDKVLTELNIPYKNSGEGTWATNNKTDSTKITLQTVDVETQLKKGTMPNLSGMSAKDALFLLENNGLNVKIQGFGAVRKQSVEAGTKFYKGAQIVLTLG
ncbi:MAG TPA: penicillin-binding protein [Bacteroidia bacterium]|jgi:cell division protein FtsI (penicillin-binding protein 3)|nr:penicillin-binding protein [Bacteroidia bacterium]